MTEPDDLPSRPNPVLVAVGLLIYAAAGAGTAIFETLLVPLRHGTTLVPLTVLLAIVTNAALPRLARTLNDTAWAGVVPALTWAVMVVVLLSSRREGDVLVTTVPTDLKYVAYGMFFGGIIAAVLTLATANPYRRSIAVPQVQPDSDTGGVR